MDKIVTQRVDDFDGKSEATHRVPFVVDGTWFQLDLSDANLKRFTTALAPFVDKATKLGPAEAAPVTIASEERTERSTLGLAQVPGGTVTPIRGTKRQRSRGSAPAANGDTKTARGWLTAHGYDVPVRGNLSADNWDAYNARRPAPAPTAQGG